MSFSCLLVPFKTSFLSPFIFPFQRFLSLAGYKWQHILSSFQEIKGAKGVCAWKHLHLFLSWKINLWFDGGFEWCMPYKKKKKKSGNNRTGCAETIKQIWRNRGTDTIFLWLLSVLHTTEEGEVILELRWRCSYHIDGSITAEPKWIS